MTPLSEIIVPLESRRRQRAAFAQKLQHAVAGVFLLFQGLNTLSHGPEGLELAIAVIEVVTSGLLMVAMIRVVRQLRRRDSGGQGHAHHGIDWVDVLIAAVLGAEGLEHWHTTHHLPRPTIVLALSLLVIGLMHGRIAAAGGRRRALRVGPTGLTVPHRRFFGREVFSWNQIAGITIGTREAVIEIRNGPSRTIDLADLDNASQVVAALQDAQSRVPTAPPPPPALSPVVAPALSPVEAPVLKQSTLDRSTPKA